MKIIVAVDKNNGIGFENQLPWKCKEDMAHFRMTTSGHVVVMGYNTWKSVGALKNRINILYNPKAIENEFLENFYIINNVRGILFASKVFEIYKKNTFVIGGAKTYEKFLNSQFVDEIILTRINEEHKCDTFFYIPNGWEIQKTVKLSERATVEYYGYSGRQNEK